MKTINISDFHGAMDALRSRDLAQALYEAGELVMKDALISLHGEEHHRRRVTEFAVFGRGFFRYYERDVFPPAMERTLAPYLEAGRADLVEFGYRITMNLTADFAGIDRPEQSVEETEALLRLVKTFSEGATLVHSTRERADVEAEVRDALAEFDERFLNASRRRRETLVAEWRAGDLDEDELPRDVVTILLKNLDKLEMSDETFRREVAFYLQAGAHSTANSTTHAMHEILNWCDGDDGMRGRLIDDIGWLQRCVHESLRLHPASPVAWRRATAPVQLRNREQIDAGDHVIVDLRAANRDENVFGGDAGRFNPNRELPPNVWPFGLTFGYGMHACMGRDLDGGVVPKKDMQPEKRQLGIVATLIHELLKHGARRDPDDAPVPDTSTERQNWARYPIVFDRRH
ncbi:MAG: cytochrome P450 [Pseudomonadota bacterium]